MENIIDDVACLSYSDCKTIFISFLKTLYFTIDSMTDHFIHLANSLYDPNFFKFGGQEALNELFNHCLITVVQPSGTDCVAVTKYEKVGKDFLAKIKTRIICLLDPERIRERLELFSIGKFTFIKKNKLCYMFVPFKDVTLYLKDRKADPGGDPQSPLQWKTRTILCDGKELRTFLYIEFGENDSIKLTKKNSNKKLLYNNGLCQLEFRTKFKVIFVIYK
jgi:hypothetical protein